MDTFARLIHGSKNVQENRQVSLNKTIEEKRPDYKCKKNYVTLSEIPTWPQFYNTETLEKSKISYEAGEVNYGANDLLNSKIGVFTGDITCLEIDSIVNAANKKLLGGGGVDGAIHRAAGNLLYDECRTLNGCRTGEAKITAGYNLPAKYVIHTVGPIGYYPDDLKNAYTNSLDLALTNKLRSIAFPCISTGVYGYPNDKAAREVLELLRNYLEKNYEKIDRVILCLFMEKDIELYKKYLQIYFPINTNKKSLKSISSDVTKDLIEPVNNLDVSNEDKEDSTVKTESNKEACRVIKEVKEYPEHLLPKPEPVYTISFPGDEADSTKESRSIKDTVENCHKVESTDSPKDVVEEFKEERDIVSND